MKNENDYWTSKAIVEPSSGKYYRKYFYKRRVAHRVIVDTPKAKALAGYVLIEKDLRCSIAWTNQIKELLKDEPQFLDPMGSVESPTDHIFTLSKGFFVAALTFYGKCFASCKGRRIKLERKNLSESFLFVHDDAIEYRNNFAAHSGAKMLERAVVVLALDKKRKSNPFFSRELYQPDVVSQSDLDEFLALFEHVKGFVEGKINELSDKVYDEDVLPKGADYWYAQARH